MEPLVFVTANRGKHREVQKLLSGLDVRWARLALARPPGEDLAAIAKARVLEAYAQLRAPVFLESTGLFLWDHGGAPGGAFKRTWRELGEEGFAARFGGSPGVARVLVAYAASDDPAEVRLFEGSVAGTLLTAPRGAAGYGWDRLWMPDGFGRTLAEMHDSSYVVNMRAAPYLALADHVRGGGAGVYEAHVTVAPCDMQAFRAACAELGAKCIAIELPAGAAPLHSSALRAVGRPSAEPQAMTATFHRGALLDVQGEVMALARALVKRGFDVTRTKIEAHGRAHGAPESDAEAASMPKTSYFEFHVKLVLPASTDTDALAARLRAHGGALSRNAHKAVDAGGVERFVTMRAYGVGRATAEARFAALSAEIDRLGLVVRNRIREYTVFDTNVGLDAGWLA